MKKDHVAAGLVAAVALGLWANVWAMPTQAELKKAQPLVAELMAPALKEFKAADAKEKAAAAVKVADASAEFAKAAETEAAKFLLLKGAVNFYTRGEEYDKAADAVETLKASVKDVTPAVISEIAGKATGKISETKAPRLFALYRKAKLQLHAASEAKTLAQKLKKVKSDALQRRYAEALAISGDWKTAYAEFAKLSDAKLKAVVEAEAKDKAKNAESGEFWWAYKPDFEEADDFFKEHAAVFYRKALAAGEITGLKKNIVEQRIKDCGGSQPDVTTTKAKAIGPIELKAGGDSPFTVNGDVAMLKLANGAKIEFVKCPAGCVKLVDDYFKRTTRRVRITRPFWVMRKCLTKEDVSMDALLSRSYAGSGFIEPDVNPLLDFCAELTETLRSVLPTGYVVRLPSLVEWEYSFHAGSYDPDDLPYGNLLRGYYSENEVKYFRHVLPVKNKWGLHDFHVLEKVLDRIDKRNAEVDPKDEDRIIKLPLPTVGASDDLFFWSEDNEVPCAQRGPAYERLISKSRKEGTVRLVIGPDLVSEWKAKQKDSGAAAPAAGEATPAVATTDKPVSAWQEKGNEATLDLGEKHGKLEFVKCPAGSVRMTTGRGEVTRVNITRPFWIMKTPVTCRQISFHPQERNREGYAHCLRERTEEFIDLVTKERLGKGALPLKYVLRLPTLAEIEYAFHANTHDRSDPYYDWLADHVGDASVSKKWKEKANAWGLRDFGWEKVLDKFMFDALKDVHKNNKDVSRTKNFNVVPVCVPEDKSDPLFWTEDEKEGVYVSLMFDWALWRCRLPPSVEGGGDYTYSRLVVGPDLVSEWKAKNAKK